ncbi:MAG: hypothetical protein HYS83_02610 [Candidatus Blackburnbacteria bacterium]|nr:hypothetical protein [Candidatus Blackburnbacteria bacterium]
MRTKTLGIRAKTNKLSRESARVLIEFIAQQSFNFWQQNDFRKLVNFKNIDQIEQDRIFNELIVTGIGLLDLHLAGLVRKTRDGAKVGAIKTLHKESLLDYPRMLKELGTPANLTNTWTSLIKIRIHEYREGFQLALREMTKWEELQEKPSYKLPIARIQTCAIACLHHIRRGKTAPNDILWTLIRRWLTYIEGNLGNITSQFLITT